MKILLTFKEIYLSEGRVVTKTLIEAGSWLFEDGLVKFYAEKEPSKCIAVYDMGCLVGFEVIDAK